MNNDDIQAGNTPLIMYFFEEVEPLFDKEKEVEDWIMDCIAAEGQIQGNLNFIFCSDEYLHKINLEYLQHDDYTDVITFPYSDQKVEGDVFISLERVRENSKNFEVTFENELHRVMIHGILHLLGYSDKTETDKEQMRRKEDSYLRLINN